MATIASSLVIFTAGTPVDVDKAVVVASCDQLIILTHLNDVDMATISAWRVDTIDEPAELNGMRCPLSGGCGGGTTRLVFFRMWIEEEQLVGSTGRTDPVSI